MISAGLQAYRGSIEPDLDALIGFFEPFLESQLHGLNIEAISHRKKSALSIQQKLQVGKVSNVNDLKDLVGMTVVVLYRHEIPEAMKLVKDSALRVEDPGLNQLRATDFRYREPKLYVRPPESFMSRHPDMKIDICEMQFTTALQHALDKATHDFDYKGSNYSWENFRLVAQMRGMLEMIDRSIDDIGNANVAPDVTAAPPDEMLQVAAVIDVLNHHFADRMPTDRRRMGETVLRWIEASSLESASLDDVLSQNSDLLQLASIDPTSATLGALLRTSPDLVDQYKGSFLVTNELATFCAEAEAVPAERRVTGY